MSGIRVLLDTHTLLWALFQPEKLSDRVRDLLGEPRNIRFVSAASAWEISTKHRLGKLEMASPLIDNYKDHLDHFMATELPISTRHALMAGGFRQNHRDPFDRILAAQGILEELPVVTADVALEQFPVRVVW